VQKNDVLCSEKKDPSGILFKEVGKKPKTQMKTVDHGQPFPPTDPHKITRVRCWYSKLFIVGIEVFYNDNSPGAILGTETDNITEKMFELGPLEHIVEISGETSTSIKWLRFKLTSGKQHLFGNDSHEEVKADKKADYKPFVVKHPDLVIRSFKFGTQKYLKTLGVYFGEPYVSNLKKAVRINLTNIGYAPLETKCIAFDDYEKLIKGVALDAFVLKVSVMHNEDVIYGLEVHYIINGEARSTGLHQGGKIQKNPLIKTSTLNFEEDELITCISGMSDSENVYKLRIKTNFEKELEVGSDEKGEPFGKEFTDIKVIAFAGVTGSNLTSLSVYVA